MKEQKTFFLGKNLEEERRVCFARNAYRNYLDKQESALDLAYINHTATGWKDPDMNQIYADGLASEGVSLWIAVADTSNHSPLISFKKLLSKAQERSPQHG